MLRSASKIGWSPCLHKRMARRGFSAGTGCVQLKAPKPVKVVMRGWCLLGSKIAAPDNDQAENRRGHSFLDAQSSMAAVMGCALLNAG